MRQPQPVRFTGPDMDSGEHDAGIGVAILTDPFPATHRSHCERLRRVEVSPLQLEDCGGTIQIAMGVGGGGLPELPRPR